MAITSFFENIGEGGMEKAISIIKEAAPKNKIGEKAADGLIAKIPTAQQFIEQKNQTLPTHNTTTNQEAPVPAPETTSATGSMENDGNMMAKAKAILEKLGSGVSKTLLALNVATIPTGILADMSEAETKISELVKNGTLSQDAASEYGSMYTHVKGIQKLTGGIDTTLGHGDFLEWANKHGVSSSLFADLDPTEVSRKQKELGIPNRSFFEEIAMSTPKFPVQQDPTDIHPGLSRAQGSGRGLV